MVFIDVHCHLDICNNLPEIIKISKEKGIKIIITNGLNHLTNKKSLEFAEKYPEVKVALGLYPIDALLMSGKEIEKEIEFIKKNKKKIIAIGEVGLDLKKSDNLENQKKILEKFINLAKELDKPIIIHSRKAEKEVIEFLESFKIKKVVMHCFSGNMNLVKRIINNNWCLSIPANIKNSTHFQSIVKEAPIENLLCETDSPFLHPDKERENSPINVIESYKKIAEIKKLSIYQTEKIIENNFKRVFT
jgi:TatD DNase family protein